uniref:Uncharacterized protein n=1 Tax=Glossina morsitans morsitans TaxID=37546 RepID=A0A1B0FPD6_GLOMM
MFDNPGRTCQFTERGNTSACKQVRCAACSYPRYEPFDKTKTYRIVAPIFLVNGGDGFHMIRDHSTDIQYHQTDLDALLNYTNKTSPIITGIEGRIIINK